jgi:hypothetical protein
MLSKIFVHLEKPREMKAENILRDLCGLALVLATGCAEVPQNTTDNNLTNTKAPQMTLREVSTTSELIEAVQDASVKRIVVLKELSNVPMLRLSAGQALTASPSKETIRFAGGQDGLELSSDNKIENLVLVASPEKRAVFNDTTVSDLGRLELRNITVDGIVQIIAMDRVRAGNIEAHDIEIRSADAREYSVRPKGYGVEVIPGAFTLWNQQADTSVTITADLTGISAGLPNAPVRGSGIFVCGGGDAGGRLLVRRLETGMVHSDAGIAEGTPDRISAGVFTGYGTLVNNVHTLGTVTTYGPNDMVLDNWGVVDHWISDKKVTSHGPSGIGFVNFGTITTLNLKEPIETFGQGARGFNVYSGTVANAEFDRIVTHGNGAVGIQISQPIGEISVLHGIETFGGSGESLVKGVLTKLSAVAFSVKPEGSVRALKIGGGLITHGPGVAPIEVQGVIESLLVKDKVAALKDQNKISQQTNKLN